MKVAMWGGLAWNSFNAAKFLRQYTDIEADSYDFGVDIAYWHPAWEEALFAEDAIPESCFNWTHAPFIEPWERPSWAKIMGWNRDGRPHWPAWYDTQEECENDLRWVVHHSIQEARRPITDPLVPAYYYPDPTYLHAILRASRCTAAEADALISVCAHLPRWEANREVAEHYDLTVLYGPSIAHTLLLPPAKPVIAFEHGTIRNLHTNTGIIPDLFRASCLYANHIIVTNADCARSLDALGIKHYRFIPHPVNEYQFTPGPSPYRETVLRQTGTELLFFCPTRRTKPGTADDKCTERMIAAFHRYVTEAEPRGAPSAALVLLRRGHQDITTTEIAEREITHRIYWRANLPKRHLVQYYRLADIVLDQFNEDIGSFGTIVVEALACGRPVITHISAERHEWCRDVLPELPPTAEASTTDEIYQQLVRLATDAGLRDDIGKQSREWVEQYHSSKRVAELHQTLYEEVLA